MVGALCLPLSNLFSVMVGPLPLKLKLFCHYTPGGGQCFYPVHLGETSLGIGGEPEYHGLNLNTYGGLSMKRHDVISPKERRELLGLYDDLRVCDVRDGMDTLMMHHVGSMVPAMRPVFRTRACGIAKTARYLPYAGTIPTMTPKKYWEWSGWYYGNVCTYPWMEDIQDGDFCVIDQSGVDAGLL